eukprot:9477778-Pyramimonas_sp.AAC.1
MGALPFRRGPAAPRPRRGRHKMWPSSLRQGKSGSARANCAGPSAPQTLQGARRFGGTRRPRLGRHGH